MDWSKAKNIILLVLVLTNLFLLAVYGNKYFGDDGTSDEEILDYTVSLLDENDIEYRGEIYNKTRKMHPLTVSYGQYDSNMVKNAISTLGSLPDGDESDESCRKLADSLLEKCGFMTENVYFSGIERDQDSICVIYENHYNDIPVQECYMKVYLENGRVTDFDRKWMEIIEESDPKIEVMSQLSAMMKFMTEVEGRGHITIDKMYLTYWIDSYDVEGDILFDTALPAWCFEYNGGQKMYISAGQQ